MGGGTSRAPRVKTALQRTNVAAPSSGLHIAAQPQIAPPLTLHLDPTPVTPRRGGSIAHRLLASSISERSSMFECIPATPCTSAEIAMFNFYCPLCMSWFQDGLLTLCCGNNLCITCFNGFVERFGLRLKNGRMEDHGVDEVTSRKIPFCPHCQAEKDFAVTNYDSAVHQVRKYANSPKPGGAGNGGGAGPSSGETSFPFPSPVKIGDDFDSLQRKLRPFVSQAGDYSSLYVHQKEAESFVNHIVEEAIRSFRRE